MEFPRCHTGKGKAMGQFCSCFLEDSSDSAEPGPPNAQSLPSLSQRYPKSLPLCSYAEPSHCFEGGFSIEWDPVFLPCVFEGWDFLSYQGRSNCVRKLGTEVFYNESQKEPQVASGDVDSDKDSETEKSGQPSPGLLRDKGLHLEASDGGDCPQKDPVSGSPRCLGCWPWLQRAFGRKKKQQQKCKATQNCLEPRRPEECN
ncbi:uncharacterized protein LOC127212188 [Acomys russatus]|uniref:uncharacterized protein LOC127212188 n=1 Tax=Acomys russatus TaxID=60746 RepID=UPI0021E33D1A|nr:uncharacterized protein LOC127212188 [Acomys russatus]